MTADLVWTPELQFDCRRAGTWALSIQSSSDDWQEMMRRAKFIEEDCRAWADPSVLLPDWLHIMPPRAYKDKWYFDFVADRPFWVGAYASIRVMRGAPLPVVNTW